MRIVECEICGTEFEVEGYKVAKYCSYECKMIANRIRARESKKRLKEEKKQKKLQEEQDKELFAAGIYYGKKATPPSYVKVYFPDFEAEGYKKAKDKKR